MNFLISYSKSIIIQKPNTIFIMRNLDISNLKRLLIFSIISIQVLFFNCQVTIGQEIGYPIIKNYTSKEFKGDPQIMCSIQDDRGVIYFGSNKLIEYDGVSWREVYSKEIVCAYDLKKDKNGKIYVAAIDEFGYLTLDSKGYTTYVSLTHLLPDAKIKLGILTSIAITSGNVYFQSLEYTIQYSPKKGEVSVFHAENGDAFKGFIEYKENCYVISREKGIQKIENNQLKSIGQSDFFDHKSFSNALQIDNSTFLVTQEDKWVYLYNLEKNVNPRQMGEPLNNFLLDNRLSRGAMLSNGNFILGSIKKGAALFNSEGELLQQYSEDNHLQNNFIFSTYAESSNNFWFSLNNGISKTSQSQDLSYWDKTSGLKNSVVSIHRYNGIIYFGTFVKTYYIDNKNKINEVKGIPDGIVWCFLEPTQNKSLLVGTKYGIYQIAPNKKVSLVFKGSHATFLYQSKVNPNRYFSSDDESFISFRFENNKWIFEGRWKGVKDDIRFIKEEENGELWICTFMNGLIRVTPDFNNITIPRSVRYYNQNKGLKTLMPLSISTIRNRLVVNTPDGFYAYNKVADKFEPYCEFGEPFCNGDRSILYSHEMPDGKIWICPSNNQTADIGYLQPNPKGGYEWIYKPFRRFPHFSPGVMYVEPTGIAWFGGIEGVYRYDLNKDTKDYSQKFNCLIRKVTCGQDSTLNISIDNEKNFAKLAYNFNSMKFEFAAPFFDNEERTLYSYKLEGFDKEWSEWSQQTQKEYTYLQEGEYKFMVKARNIYGVESETATFQIRILPPFYRSWWAYLTYCIALAFIIYGIVRLNMNRLQKEKQKLEEIVKQRTSTIEEQKEKLEIANATKDKFFSIIAHDLKSPFNSIMGFSDLLIDQIKEKDYEGIDKYARIIGQSSQRAMDLLMNLLEWSRSQTGRMKFNPENFDLVDLIVENKLLFDEIAAQKGITIKKVLPHDLVVFADKPMISTVLRNLISNAIKFTRQDGEIIISAEKRANEILVSVSDNGVGISTKRIDTLFRLDKSESTTGTAKEQGTGLGLILCKEFIEKHGGKIWVESEEGIGSTFYFTC
jgi:signal transduction histidine kinase